MSTTTNPDPAPGSLAFVPLEANPELMTSLLHNLGLSKALQIHDVYSITEPELLAFVPRPALALLLVFPVSATYESARLAEDAGVPEYTGSGDKEPVLWYRQTIRNACGLMGLLHAVSNGPARGFIEPDTPLHRLLNASIPLHPTERSALLEKTPELATAHQEAASRGATAAPDAQDDVDLHYVCFVKTEVGGDGSGGTLWELDGRRKGPIARGHLGPNEDVLSEQALLWGPLKFLERGGGDMRFSCVALAGALD
ncbi:ubiquitin carboxyl-terminal hydrolase [Hypoxylon fragiforme]|uniref:ubiquitin carboxyl-terminal hydrolase n=1 Tax=Hypoxylon fragiforme TaxID=63214 RepID=UPI0020C642B6|nr:ubiquitin carboxyl-terminal hydrolase [Hypoxylon fragiforme]KAI2607254.1 ubiquitin carboxyl-terminal hydrolase [Hypoxylon fragiforme]